METNNTTTSNGVHNTHTKDNAAKIQLPGRSAKQIFQKGSD